MANLNLYDIPGAVNAGFDRGRDRKVNALLSEAMKAQPEQRNSILANMAGANQRGAKIANTLSQQDAKSQQVMQEQKRVFAQKGYEVMANLPPEQRQSAWQSWVQTGNQIGLDMGQTPLQYSDENLMRLQMMGTGGDKANNPAAIQEFQMISDILNNPDRYPETTVQQARIRAGLDPRAVGSSGMTIVNQGMTQPVAQSEGVIAGTKAGATEAAKLTAQGQLKPGVEAATAQAVEEAKAGVKAKVNAPKQAEKIRLITSGIDTTISSIDEALDLVDWNTTGALGKTLANIPGTDAYTLKQTALTVRANIGFDRLQAMRDASPTGGALGQVAVQELDALQASIRSLDLGLPADKLAANLNKVKQHYTNWRDAVNMVDSGEAPGQDKGQPPGFTLMEDANGNKAYVGPNGEIQEL